VYILELKLVSCSPQSCVDGVQYAMNSGDYEKVCLCSLGSLVFPFLTWRFSLDITEFAALMDVVMVCVCVCVCVCITAYGS